MAIAPFKKAFLISGAPIHLTRAPPGLAFLAGVCEHVGIDYEAYDLNTNFLVFAGRDVWDATYLHINTGNGLETLSTELLIKIDSYLEQVINVISQSGADCVAISLLSYVQQSWAERFLKALKQAQLPVVTLGGGPGMCVPGRDAGSCNIIFGRHCVELGILDYFCLGEGEIVMPEFLKGCREMPGLNSQHTANIWQPQLDTLDQFATPSYQQIDFDHYDTADTGRHIISITGSRGCVRRCSFCDVGHMWKKYRYRSGQHIANEVVKHFEQTGVTDFWFTDSLINGSLKQFNELTAHFAENRARVPGLNQLTYTGQFIIRPKQSHPEEMYQRMRDSGCEQVIIGVESGSESVREHMGKQFSNDDIDWHFHMCEKYGIKNWLLMIVGYPTETEQDFEASKNLLRRSQRYVLNHTILGVNLQYMMAVLPNTPLVTMNELGLHFLEDFQEAYINWHSTANPDLTLARRYQRFAELVETALDLRYNLPHEILYFMEKYQRTDSTTPKSPTRAFSIILSS
jgi:hypothetical protein